MIPKIVFFGAWDYAGWCWRVCEAWNEVAGEVRARRVFQNKHKYGFPYDLLWRPHKRDELYEELSGFIDKDTWLCVGGDGCNSLVSLVRQEMKLDNPIAAVHIGSDYRAHPGVMDQADRKLGVRVRFVGLDLVRLSSLKATVPMLLPHWPAKVRSGDLSFEGPVRIAHSPSGWRKKGTAKILEVFEGLSGCEVDLIEKVPIGECLERRSKAHVFVDQLSEDIGGFGLAATEALAQGCAVVTDARHAIGPARDFFESLPVIQVIDTASLRSALEWLVSDLSALQQLRMRSIAWSLEWTSAQAVVSWFAKHLEKHR